MFFINPFSFTSLLVLFFTIVVIYFYFTRKFNFWKSKGIDGPRPIILFGTFYQIFRESAHENSLENYKKYGKIYGGFFGDSPILSVADPEIINDICIKDFNTFVNRSPFITGNPLTDKMLFNLVDEDWKRIRSIISPTFSSGKMRRMHPIIVDCVKRLKDDLDKKVLNQSNNKIELKEVMEKLTLDVIATCAFGTRINVYNEEKTDSFIQNVDLIMKPGVIGFILATVMSIFPKLARLFTKLASPLDYFRAAFIAIKEKRQSEDRKYNDFLQLMLNAINKTNEFEEKEIEDKSAQFFGHSNMDFKNIKLGTVTDDDLFANCFQFLMASYDTTASFLSFFFYSLAVNEECQQKLYEEIKSLNGEFGYESIGQMPYMEACVAETLRLYNTLPTFLRKSSQEYTIGDTGITIPKETLVSLEVHVIHHSPEYYPDPDRWDPQRFMPENRHKLVPHTYLPFGIGPRNCVGMRFALMEVKTAIAHLVNRYEFFKTADTKPLTKPNKYTYTLSYGHLYVGFKPRL